MAKSRRVANPSRASQSRDRKGAVVSNPSRDCEGATTKLWLGQTLLGGRSLTVAALMMVSLTVAIRLRSWP